MGNDTTNINTKVNSNLYIEFKHICLEKRIKVYDGIRQALALYIESFKKENTKNNVVNG